MNGCELCFLLEIIQTIALLEPLLLKVQLHSISSVTICVIFGLRAFWNQVRLFTYLLGSSVKHFIREFDGQVLRRSSRLDA
jgi:hypothetical protein